MKLLTEVGFEPRAFTVPENFDFRSPALNQLSYGGRSLLDELISKLLFIKWKCVSDPHLATARANLHL